MKKGGGKARASLRNNDTAFKGYIVPSINNNIMDHNFV